MKFIKQTKLHIPGKQSGNCLWACFASIMGVPIDSIPHFYELHPNNVHDAHEAMESWLLSQGWFVTDAYTFQDEIPSGCVYIVSGYTNRSVSGREDLTVFELDDILSNRASKYRHIKLIQHACLYMNGSILFDPHPSNTGLIKKTQYEILSPIPRVDGKSNG